MWEGDSERSGRVQIGSKEEPVKRGPWMGCCQVAMAIQQLTTEQSLFRRRRNKWGSGTLVRNQDCSKERVVSHLAAAVWPRVCRSIVGVLWGTSQSD